LTGFRGGSYAGGSSTGACGQNAGAQPSGNESSGSDAVAGGDVNARGSRTTSTSDADVGATATSDTDTSSGHDKFAHQSGKAHGAKESSANKAKNDVEKPRPLLGVRTGLPTTDPAARMPSWMPQRYNEAAPSKFPEYLIAITELAQEACAHTPTGGNPGQMIPVSRPAAMSGSTGGLPKLEMYLTPTAKDVGGFRNISRMRSLFSRE
jgi:hypothetical protein